MSNIHWGTLIIGVILGWLVLPVVTKVLGQKGHPAVGG